MVTDLQLVCIRKHATRTYWQSQSLMQVFNRSLYAPRNPFNFRTEHEFYIAWRTEWRKVVAEHKAQSSISEKELQELGVTK